MTNLNKNEHRPISTTTALILSLTVAIVALCAWVANRLWHQDVSVTFENRIIENTQVLFLVLATCLHAWQTRSPQAQVKTVHISHMVLGMLCLSIMVREIDIDKLGPQPGWELAENLIRLTGGAAWIWLLAHVYNHRLSLWQRKADVLCTSTSVLTGIGVMLYMASWVFDKSVVPLPADRSQLWEETLQLSGTICLFTASLRPINLR